MTSAWHVAVLQQRSSPVGPNSSSTCTSSCRGATLAPAPLLLLAPGTPRLFSNRALLRCCCEPAAPPLPLTGAQRDAEPPAARPLLRPELRLLLRPATSAGAGRTPWATDAACGCWGSAALRPCRHQQEPKQQQAGQCPMLKGLIRAAISTPHTQTQVKCRARQAATVTAATALDAKLIRRTLQ